MATATLIACLRSGPLRESIDNGSARVDRNKGIIYGVKVVGRFSPNTHDQPGVTEGTEYTEDALRQELPLIEGINVNINHPPLRKVRSDRDATERFAWIQEARLTSEGIFGDLHFLDPTDPFAVRVMNAAEKKPDAFALSHHAYGDGPVENGIWKIMKVGKVVSVDIVADGGTNKSLFEGAEVKKPIKLRELCESKAELKDKLAPLFKILPTVGEMLVEAEDQGADYRDHLHAAKKMCEDAGDSEMAGKIHKLMAPEKEEKGEKKTEEDESEEKNKEEVKEGDEEEKKDKESRAMESLRRDMKVLQDKDACRELCESLQFVPSKLQIKAMVALTREERREYVKEQKSLRGGRGGAQSRSLIPAPSDGGELTESLEDVPAKAEDQLNWLRS